MKYLITPCRIIIFVCLIPKGLFLNPSDPRTKSDVDRMKELRDFVVRRSYELQYDGPEHMAKIAAENAGFQFIGKIAGNVFSIMVMDTDDDLSTSRRSPDNVQDKLDLLRQTDKQVLDIMAETYAHRVKKNIPPSRPDRHKRSTNNANWTDQWYLHSSHSPSMGIKEAWDKGYTGSGVHVAVLDDGIETTHDDLTANLVIENCYDYIHGIQDPSHKNNGDGHGTNCAGIVTAGNNSACVIGIAHQAHLAGVRMLGTIDIATAAEEARALIHKLDVIDIYSNSYGPSDEGQEFFTLPTVEEEALKEGVTQGRGGLGAIYTWASGNGGQDGDDCNADGFVTSPYTIAIASLSPDTTPVWYSEPCSSILAATYGGDSDHDTIATTKIGNACTDTFQGTSAACPVASGIIALVLQANPNLTWRDIQHLIVETSNSADLDASHNFVENGAGKKVSLTAGFGLLNAGAMVDAALTWKTVPPRLTHDTDILYTAKTGSVLVSSSRTIDSSFIKFIEHIEITVRCHTPANRGNMQLYLTSPLATANTRLLKYRFRDNSEASINIRFMSVHQWGESVTGTWKLTVQDYRGVSDVTLSHWKLVFYGTLTDPLLGRVADGGEGAACNDSSPCADPYSCYDSTVCVSCLVAEGYRDYNGTCLQDGSSGSACNDTSPCDSGLQCVNGKCQLPKDDDTGNNDGTGDTTLSAGLIVAIIVASGISVATVAGVVLVVASKLSITATSRVAPMAS